MGHAARARRHVDPQNTIFSAKRLIGQSIRSPVVRLAMGVLPYQCVEGPNEQPLVVSRDRRYTIPEISSFILKHIKQCAERHLGEPVSKAVITVPANFTDSQRQATKYAGELAGLKVLRILNEPTAAALAYGFGRAMEAKLAIYDLGGGTFDVTVLQIRDKIFEVLSTGGDSFLGGDDFDKTLVDRLAGISWLNTGSICATIRWRGRGCELRASRSSAGSRKTMLSRAPSTISQSVEEGNSSGLDFEVTRDDSRP